ncbi:MAG: hypothetical protein ABSG91_23010, partial [Syntrophobacteraceae bacterium]
MSVHRKRYIFFVVFTALLLMSHAESGAAKTFTLNGRVESNGTPLSGYKVSLQAYFPGDSSEKILGTDTTGSVGTFAIRYQLPSSLMTPSQQPILFVRATKKSSTLAAAAGRAPLSNDVVVNERTTVANGFAFAQFINGKSINGNTYGMINAVNMAANMANPATGGLGSVLELPPNGPDTTALATFNSLANMVASCAVPGGAGGGCKDLLNATTPPGGASPHDVLQAVANIAKFPWLNTAELYSLSLIRQTYSPSRTLPPDSWGLFLKFTGTHSSAQTSHDLMNGPGNFAIDERGFLWVNDNFVPQSPSNVACAGLNLLKFYPWGEKFPGSPYYGGGLEGAGFGITLAPNHHIWIGNFGFEAPECTPPGNPFGVPAPHNSVSEFLPNGVAISPNVTGYRAGNIFWPQATVSDLNGNIWLANCGNNSVTIYPKGNPRKAINASDIGLVKPFGLAIDGKGNGWVT